MQTFHHMYPTGHTAAILRETHAMACDASRRVKIAAKCLISSHRVARPYICLLVDARMILKWAVQSANRTAATVQK